MYSKTLATTIKHASGLLLTAALMAGFVSTRVQGVSLTLDPPTQTASVGDSINVLLQVSGLADGTSPSLGAFDLFVNFNPAVLTYDSVLFGSMLGPIAGSSDGFVIDQFAGSLNLFAVSLDSVADLDSLQPGQFLLADIRFSASGAGSSPLDLSSIILADAFGTQLIPDSVQGASITVVPVIPAVPEGGLTAPGLFLLAFAIVGAQLVRRQQTIGAENFVVRSRWAGTRPD